MLRNTYSDDPVTYSPQGRIFQIEYASRAVLQGGCVTAGKSKTGVAIAAIMRTPGELSAYQPKLFKIDDHISIGISGLAADARALTKFMRQEALGHEYTYETPIKIQTLVRAVADSTFSQNFILECHENTFEYGKRPYGVGFLAVGYDKLGPRIFEIVPSGMYFEYHGHAIGSRCQAARTYLEKNSESLPDADKQSLLVHVTKSLMVTLRNDELSTENFQIVYVSSSGVEFVKGNDLEEIIRLSSAAEDHEEEEEQ